MWVVYGEILEEREHDHAAVRDRDVKSSSRTELKLHSSSPLLSQRPDGSTIVLIDPPDILNNLAGLGNLADIEHSSLSLRSQLDGSYDADHLLQLPAHL